MKFIKKYSMKLASTSSDVFMGTRLLFMDCCSGATNKATAWPENHRAGKKLKGTLTTLSHLSRFDSNASSCHAAIVAAIKKYKPYLIPSPYSSERLDAVKQLQKTKKMEVQSWIKLEDTSSSSRLS